MGKGSDNLKILKNKLREGASICQDADHWGKLTFCHSHACRKWDFGVTSVTLKVVSFLRLFLGEIASGVSGKVSQTPTPNSAGIGHKPQTPTSIPKG